jgi:hypothetical protein
MKIGELAKQVSSLSDAVRDHINTHRYQSVLLDDSKTWNQICSSLDAIGDSIHAVESYDAAEFPKDVGLRYVYTYGILQSLFLMQDALRHLSEAFNLPFELPVTLKEIRKVRNASIGHPTKQDESGQRYYNFISRISMAKSGFDLLRSTGDRRHSFKRVDIMKACSDQLYAVVTSYENIVQKLEEIDRMHREKFKNILLADVFHSAMGYFFEKIAQGIHAHSYGDREFGHRHVGQVKETYVNFKVALAERNELSQYTEYDLDEYFHALNKLDKFLSVGDLSMTEADARIYLSYLRNEHEHFVQVANEIDKEYELKR